jgi:hypothetical protein
MQLSLDTVETLPTIAMSTHYVVEDSFIGQMGRKLNYGAARNEFYLLRDTVPLFTFRDGEKPQKLSIMMHCITTGSFLKLYSLWKETQLKLTACFFYDCCVKVREFRTDIININKISDIKVLKNIKY